MMFSLMLASATVCALPERWGGTPTPGPGLDPIANIVAVRQGQRSWNGVSTDDLTLRIYMTRVQNMNPRPVTQIDTTNMTCDEARDLLSALDPDGSCTPYWCRAYDLPPRHPAPPPLRR